MKFVAKLYLTAEDQMSKVRSNHLHIVRGREEYLPTEQIEKDVIGCKHPLFQGREDTWRMVGERRPH